MQAAVRSTSSLAEINQMPIGQWSCNEVCSWLVSIGQESASSVFLRNKITGNQLLQMDVNKMKVSLLKAI